ncbi:peptidoglycan recognition protein family protein [Mitsuokella jalaludinii]|uniref:peptidoglycan recognition protein family protein n=1 Tax=Mitsuokella jalaludinii TaxID=187979 RepID=UPI00307B62D9
MAVISRSSLREVSIDELRAAADEAREDIWEAAKEYGREPKVYMHWTAGHYETFFDDYHVSIDDAGRIYLNGNLSDILTHTYHRNSGAVGITLNACVGATSSSLGAEAPTAAQIEAMAQAVCAICDGLWLTIDKDHVMTHGEAADNEDGIEPHEAYGPKTTCERWDLEYLGTDESPAFSPWATDGSRGGDVLRGKANWYRNVWKDAEGNE